MSSSSLGSFPEDRFRLPPRRPASVSVLAVLHLIFGGCGVIIGLCSGVMQAIGAINLIPQPPPGPANARMPFPADLAQRQQRFLEQEIPFHGTIAFAQIFMWVFFSVVLIVAGIGLFGMRPRARKLSLAFGIGAIVYQIASVLYMIAVMIPAMNAFYNQMEREFPAAGPIFAISRMSIWFGVPFSLLFLSYPIVVLVLLTRRSVVAAFAGNRVLPETIDVAEPKGWDKLPPDAFTR